MTIHTGSQALRFRYETVVTKVAYSINLMTIPKNALVIFLFASERGDGENSFFLLLSDWEIFLPLPLLMRAW